MDKEPDLIEMMKDRLLEMEDGAFSNTSVDFRQGYEQARLDMYYFVNDLADKLPQCTVCKQGPGNSCRHFNLR